MRFLWVGGLAAAMLGACGDSGDTGGGATPTPPTPDGGLATNPDGGGPVGTPHEACATRPRTFSSKPVDYFKVAPSDQALYDLYKGSRRKYLPPGSDFQKRADAANAKIFEVFKQIYPEAVEGMTTAPRSLIVDAPSFNAFALSYPATATKPAFAIWALHYHSGMFKPGVTDQQIELIAAHELAHLVLRNGQNPDIHYREPAAEAGKIFGEYRANDPAVQKFAEAVSKLGDRVGEVFNTELNGYPTSIGVTDLDQDGVEQPLYRKYLVHLFKKHQSSAIPACGRVSGIDQQITTLVKARMNWTTFTLEPGPDAAKLDGLTNQFREEFTNCLLLVNKSFVALAEEYRRAEDPNAAAELDEIGNDTNAKLKYLGIIKAEYDADVANPSQDIVPKLFGISQKLQDIVRVTFESTEAKGEAIRVYTEEDDSDEAAVRVAKVLKYDAKNLAGALLMNKSAEYQAVCADQLAKDQVPAYGAFIDSHHTNCWRQWRNIKLEGALETCPASWPAR